MRTLVELSNSNCPWCLNALVDQLRRNPSVDDVRSDAHSGCLVVDHHSIDPGALLGAIETLRAWEVAGNGERVMVNVDAHPATRCPYRD